MSVEPWGAVAAILLRGRLGLRPTGIALLHAVASSCERGLPPGGREKIAVWARVLWADKTESLGFISRGDADLIWGMWPEQTQWLTRCLGYDDPRRRTLIMPEDESSL